MLTSIAQQEILLVYHVLHLGNNFLYSSIESSSSHFFKHCTLSSSPANKKCHTSETIMCMIFFLTNVPAASQLQQSISHEFLW